MKTKVTFTITVDIKSLPFFPTRQALEEVGQAMTAQLETLYDIYSMDYSGAELNIATKEVD